VAALMSIKTAIVHTSFHFAVKYSGDSLLI